MAPSLNLTGEEKLETIFIPVISVSVSKKAGSCYGHIKQKQTKILNGDEISDGVGNLHCFSLFGSLLLA